MIDKPFNEEEIFKVACQIGSTEARLAYLRQVCGDERALIERMEELLRVYDRDSRFLESPPPEITNSPTIDHVPTEGPGTVIGPYKLLQEIGHGGMGVVFMAEQHQPVKRRVALKIIKPGMDSRQVIARFEAERQALSLMDHPNIARVLDAGTTSSGRPYFVMELVKGQPITQYCDEHHMTPRQRLELMLPVCQAIQHAHQKGIIHRDIKPSNILVAEYDSKPVPKVIDFGVAKAIHQPLTDKTMFTGLGHVVGTMEYMSPEQAKVNQLDIDTRSDIYSLGVLLYELLTGSTPFDRKRLKQAAWDEMLRIIREEEPQRPSTRISTTDELPSIAVNRGMEPKKLSGLVHGELDWIVMKALDKDRNRRYETANGFAMDLQRYLANEAVSACPPSTGYRLRKFARRNKVALVTTALVSIALILGTAVSIWQAVRATQARNEAEVARNEEATQRALAEAAATAEKAAKLDADAKRQDAERNLAFAKKGNQILTSVFDGLDPDEKNYATVAQLRNAMRDNLTKAVKELDGSAIGDPLEVATMQNELGLSLFNLGETNLAIEVFGKSLTIRMERLPPEHRDIIASMNNLATGYKAIGRFDLALPLYEESLKHIKAKLGADHPDTLTIMSNLAEGYRAAAKLDLALPLYEESLKHIKAKLGADHPDTLKSMNNLAEGYRAAGKLDLALPVLEETLKLQKVKLGAEHPATLTSMNNLAEGYYATGKFDKALPLFEETLKLRKVKLGADHPATLISMNNLAEGYFATGKFDKALPLFEETLKLRKVKLGADHPDTITSINNLAMSYRVAGKLDKALPLFEETLMLHKVRLGADHPSTFHSMSGLAQGYLAAGKFDLALPLLEETLKLTKAKLGADHPDTLTSMSNLAEGYRAAGKLDLALQLQEETLKLKKIKLGDDHPATLTSMNNLALCYQAAKKLDLALPLLEETLKLKKAKLGDEHPDTLTSMNNLAEGYRAAGMMDKALPLHEETLKLKKAKLSPDHPETLTSIHNLAWGYQAAGKLDLALPLFEEAATGVEKQRFQHEHARHIIPNTIQAYEEVKQFIQAEVWRWKWLAEVKAQAGTDSPTYAGELAGLSQNLLQQKKWTEAEPLLRECLALREKARPDDWRTFNTKSMLGGALLGQKKYANAEPLLLQGYDGLKLREDKIPANGKFRLAEAVGRLVQLYEALNQPEKTAEWRKKLPPMLKESPPKTK